MNTIYKILYKILGWYRLKTKGNFGFNGAFNQKEFNVGAVWEDLQPNGQWGMYLPRIEHQRFAWGDTMACVTYSMMNCFETILKRKYNQQWDFSDRFTAKISGTTHSGNWMYKVIKSFIDDGFVSFLFWRNDGNSWAEFYKEIPQKTKDIAINNRKTFNINYEWVSSTSTPNLKTALKQSPLWVAIYAYGKKVNGVYQRIEGHAPNHCVMLYGYDKQGNWLIYDHYLGNTKRVLAPDYIIGYAMKINIIKN